MKTVYKIGIVAAVLIGLFLSSTMLGYIEVVEQDPFLTGEIVSIGHASIEDSTGVQTDYPAVDIRIGDEKFTGIDDVKEGIISIDSLKEGMIISFYIRRDEMIQRTKKGEIFYGKLIRIVSIEPQKLTG